VNEAFSVEKGDTALSFTTRDRVSAEEVDACLQGASVEKRWLVLETPHPEERMVAAALISTGIVPGTGSVEVLAVERSGQRKGIGSQMLRRAEGILLNFRCRFVRMKVPQWREDVLEWADKRGYNETGGGLWGELDGESAEDLTRPTRYFVLTRDLLTDTRLADTFGDGTARFATATAAAKERATASANPKSAPYPASVKAAYEAEIGAPRGSVASKEGEGDKEDETARLAGFLSSVLRGMTDAEELSHITDSVKGAVAAPVADMSIATESAAKQNKPDQSPHPPLPPTTHDMEAADGTFSQAGAPDISSPSMGGQPALSATRASTAAAAAAAAASSASPIIDGDGNIFEQTRESVVSVDDGQDKEKEESIENLLGSLVRALNTTQGRADFGQLIAESSDN
ncbi:unnamed protein product, partial [Laminaria digitata]